MLFAPFVASRHIVPLLKVATGDCSSSPATGVAILKRSARLKDDLVVSTSGAHASRLMVFKAEGG